MDAAAVLGETFHAGVAEAGAFESAGIEDSVAALVEAGVDFEKLAGGFRVELHPVTLDAADCPRVGGEEEVRDLGEARIGEILNHEGHVVLLGPREAEKGSGHGFTGF